MLVIQASGNALALFFYFFKINLQISGDFVSVTFHFIVCVYQFVSSIVPFRNSLKHDVFCVFFSVLSLIPSSILARSKSPKHTLSLSENDNDRVFQIWIS